MGPDDLPLSGVRVLDLSTLLPGPLTTLMLAEAGADVLKIERPRGDEMRSYEPKLGADSANFAVLNRGKRAYAADLKNPEDRKRVYELAGRSDIVVEQFRPGVVDRLGLGYEHVRDIRPDIIYCSITGYGQTGASSKKVGHDLNYLAESGLLGVVRDAEGNPPLPPSVLADIAGGSYPAVTNILLALRRRDRTGRGCHIDISMTHNLATFAYGYFASFQAGAGWPKPGAELLTGGSPRYRVYPAADGRHLTVAALEQKFWERFCELIDLEPELRDDEQAPESTIAGVTRRIAAHPTAHWRAVFDGEDVCVAVVATYAEAVEAGLLDADSAHRLVGADFDVGTLPSPIAPVLRDSAGPLGYPGLPALPDDLDEIWTSSTA